MHFFRHNLVRRLTLLFLLSWGTLTHIATVYACESENGKKQISCCCDNAIKKDCKHQKSKTINKCDNNKSDNGKNINLGTTTPATTVCCDISYGITDASIVTSSTFTAQQVVLLDASQPPPLLANYVTDIHIGRLVVTEHFRSPSIPFTGKHTYLRTQRLRI